MNKSICFVIPYFGKWPDWFSFYLESCKFNPDITWLFFTDCRLPEEHPENTKFFKFSLEDFNRLASSKIGFKINIERPYKICDFKPVFGIIFEDYLKNYDFWGNTDIDLIYGNIRKFISEEMLEKFDVVSSLEGYTAGHFTIYRNTPKINSLFKANKDYKEIFLSRQYIGFDECFSPKYSITAIIKKETASGRINSQFSRLCKEAYNPAECANLLLDKGTLTDKKNGREYLYFHFSRMKDFCKIEELEKNKFSIGNRLCEKNFPQLKRVSMFYKYSINMEMHYLLGKAGILIKKLSPRIYKKIKLLTQRNHSVGIF